ncbi:hypothetical protein ATANTOWER_022339 [Ataeniobius toweri]|uniref:Uncharacterized protein n=1 Tax=Ataeniobius toweri TaxID=208326 RepID=A0ABU7C8W3_9TELE|nr:hypothetical protein [Ataeniobius toweri]
MYRIMQQPAIQFLNQSGVRPTHEALNVTTFVINTSLDTLFRNSKTSLSISCHQTRINLEVRGHHYFDPKEDPEMCFYCFWCQQKSSLLQRTYKTPGSFQADGEQQKNFQEIITIKRLFSKVD